ncbi:hypothetical protein CJ030_MR4G018550 [Morella rubra]|uniref:Uncharacterized protein n=1 Tax=Morella rubra TaxID=262757 RepID=A0A6A1VSQ1_9ROSI|nr:hypothetical protein CJ030_MR4G018550 [Morella rubra]
MTTAARPTWAPAKGGNEQGGTRIFGPSQKFSSRDLASHTTLKPRYLVRVFRRDDDCGSTYMGSCERGK